MKHKLVVGFVLAAMTGFPVMADDISFDPWADTWVTCDDLGREVANSDSGVDRKEIDPNTSIGMFYYVWHGAHTQVNKDNSELIAANPENPAFGAFGSYHWGYKPWFGFYKAGDTYVVAKHIQMLVDAGVDWLFFDFTNGVTYFTPVLTIINELERRDKLGLKYPKLAFMVYSASASTLSKIYNRFYYNRPSYNKYWYYYDGKPLVLCDKDEIPTSAQTYVDIRNAFTFRKSWAWLKGQKQDQWAWLEYYPQARGWTTINNKKTYEQISVSVAQHATTKVGKSYHGGRQPAIDKYGLCAETPQGLYFQEQWDEAIKQHPPVVMVTQFNEWIAIRFKIENSSQFGDVRPGATAKVGESYFVDVYNPEFSRDLEPSSNPLIRDNYYLQMVSNARKYRGVNKLPVPEVSKSIIINDSFDQWNEVEQEYRDEPGDCFYTNKTIQCEESLLRPSNDIVRCKVTKDKMNFYFYVECAEDITPFETSGTNWMRLLLNMNTKYDNGWHGYNFLVAKDATTGDYMLHKITEKGKWGWTPKEKINFRVEGNKMHLYIPRVSINHGGSEKDFDFKWIDNCRTEVDDIMYFISEGDAAPNGRFNYRYKGSNLAAVAGLDNIVEAAPASTKVVPGDGMVSLNFINNPDSVSVRAFDTQGRLILSTESAGLSTVQMQLAPGFYVINWSSPADSGSQAIKIK